ncbi:GyrI-like domain-containing protein [Flavobacterium aquicola]|uniref:AraC family transcriptional regulator n=1 Tax=Flavobacterium aquicola TaxID=1682742 RepID=A0A3E0EKT6_9FLAO|nr:GyrI-like domain-containing protein [Flavobacterium aquicola]REG98864.1 AraC family transcriptional regulator [Flavobacterium aquicola]
MTPRIVILNEKKLIGKRLVMSFTDYKPSQLWKSFMPRRKEISNNVSNDLISITVYKPDHFLNFSPTNKFEKWAAVEVTSFDNLPDEMETFTLAGGLYAVFNYKGLNTDDTVYRHIYGEWIPNSDYGLDDRPHFEILGDKYKNSDPESEEEIWIPIKQKQ